MYININIYIDYILINIYIYISYISGGSGDRYRVPYVTVLPATSLPNVDWCAEESWDGARPPEVMAFSTSRTQAATGSVWPFGVDIKKEICREINIWKTWK